jgi:hypothetical protein
VEYRNGCLPLRVLLCPAYNGALSELKKTRPSGSCSCLARKMSPLLPLLTFLLFLSLVRCILLLRYFL